MDKANVKMNTEPGKDSMRRSITPLGAWALSLGCAVGWGAFMMPGNTFLPIAGPLGTVIGILIGAVIMLIVGVNYSFMMRTYPDAGGAFSYIRGTFGYDHGFVGAWFLLLTYIAIVWANASALPLIGRYLLGDVFQFGFTYSIAGFQVSFGELLLACGVVIIGGLLCLKSKKATARIMVIMVLIFTVGITVCFAVAMLGHSRSGMSMSPAFLPDKSVFEQVLRIAFICPWAFIGFESISHSAQEFRFPVKKALTVMAVSLVFGAAIYASLAVIAASTLPEGFESWPDYIAALGRLDIHQGAPVFYAVRTALGPVGTPVLIITVLGGVLTGLIGNTIAASRLIYAMAKEGMMPPGCAKLNRRGVPGKAVLLIVCVSVIVPLFGRTAIGWIVDVTTVGSAIIYAYVSACAFVKARNEKNRPVIASGLFGLAVSGIFLLYYLIPNLLAVTAMGKESYLILAFWSAFGLAVFRFLLQRDKERKMGHSTVVWIVMLSLVLFTSLVWMRQSSMNTSDDAIDEVAAYFTQEGSEEETKTPEDRMRRTESFLEARKDSVDRTLTKNTIIEVFFIAFSVVMLISIYTIIHKREKQTEREKILAEEASRAKTSFLSSMSHEIRTPMNAIIGLDTIALKDPDLPPRTREHLEKIGASASHLLGLINDILDMTRIESGRMTLKEEEFSLRDILDQVNIIIKGQCAEKGLTFDSRVEGRTRDYYIGDDMKLKQVLINILGNSVKFTDAPGTITFLTEQLSELEDTCTMRFVMRDTGIGMDEEFIPKIFEAFSQENTDTVNRYGSTGLGMAITKRLIEMMNGDIHVDSEKGVGSTFTVTIKLKATDRAHSAEDKGWKDGKGENAGRESAVEENALLLDGLHVLMAEDIEMNAEILMDLLEMEGISADWAENGSIAVELFQAHEEGYYAAILMDVRMPVMDGLEATRAIRALPRQDAQNIPIIAMTANAFEEDVQNSLQAGMNAHLSKPIETDRLYDILAKLTTDWKGSS